MEKLVRLEYMVRDEGNYKDFGEIVFLNDFELGLGEIHDILSKKCFEDNYFLPSEWGISRLDTGCDCWESWHEYLGIRTAEEHSSPEMKLSEFIHNIQPHQKFDL
jgi:hypothetical protein